MQAIDRGGDSLRVTGERFLISCEGAQCLRWRKDAREFYYPGFDSPEARSRVSVPRLRRPIIEWALTLDPLRFRRPGNQS
jgi:hypothetical protein